MTAVLKDGDYVFDARGRIMEVSGRDELIQRALIRLKARKGQFPLDPNLGSELFRLDLNRASPDQIDPLIREALAPIHEIQVLGAERTVHPEDGRLSLTVSLKIGGDTALVALSEH